MIVGLSLRGMFRRRSRTLLALAGVAVSAALLVDMTMLASGLSRSFGELTRAQGYGLRVTPRGTLPFDSEAGIRGAAAARAEIGSIPGVTAVAPVLGANFYTVRDGVAGEPIFTTGVDPSAQMLYLLLEGEEPGADGVVVSQPLAEAYGLRLGDRLELAAELDVALGRPRDPVAFEVTGVADFLYDYAGQRSIALPIARVQELTSRPDEVSLFAVAAPGADEDRVAREIEARIESVSVYSTSELMAAMDERLSYFRQMSAILGTIALAVATLLVATIVTIGVRERFGEIATLRAIGIPANRLQLGIVVEGVALAAAGCVIGLPFGWWMARRLDAILLSFPGIPAKVSFFVFQPLPIAAALGVVVLIGGLAGVVPGRGALRSPLGHALREEAD
jgi:putative ABC transport system permease protein